MRTKNFFIVSFAAILFASCNQEGYVANEEGVGEESFLLTTVSDSLYGQVTRDVMNYIGEKIKTRTTSSITEVEAKKIVSPLSDVGASICNELIVLADEDMLEMSD